jgi:hypothetical protein
MLLRWSLGKKAWKVSAKIVPSLMLPMRRGINVPSQSHVHGEGVCAYRVIACKTMCYNLRVIASFRPSESYYSGINPSCGYWTDYCMTKVTTELVLKYQETKGHLDPR